jgi:hypothetical protein
MTAIKLLQPHGTNPLNDIGLYKTMPLGGLTPQQIVTHIERRMRPGGLRQVLNGNTYSGGALNQEHVARLKCCAKLKTV